jgi:lipopolysaccharide biosynthesis protein
VSKLTITVRDFKPLHRNTLRGFATIHINEMRLEICDVAIHQKNESNWAQLPAKPMIDRDGVVLRDRETGKIAYATVLEFDNRAVRDAFSHAVVDAVLRALPDAFEIEEGVS